MKKLLLCVVGTFLVAASPFGATQKNEINKRYSRDTASLYGYNANERLTYLCDYDEKTSYGYGSKYLYNTLDLWTGFYNFYSPQSDTMYYWILTHNKMTTNPNSINNGYFRIVSKSLTVNFYCKKSFSYNGEKFDYSTDMQLVKYTPLSYGNSSITSGASFSLGLDATGTFSESPSISIGINGSVGFSSGVTTDNVVMTPTSTSYAVSMNYVFQGPHIKKVNNQAPYRGDFITNCAALYKVEHYSSHKGEELEFTISTKATSQKYTVGTWVCTGYETESSNSTRKVSFKL